MNSLDRPPSRHETLTGEFAHRWALAKLGNCDADDFIQLDANVSEELEGALDADHVVFAIG